MTRRPPTAPSVVFPCRRWFASAAALLIAAATPAGAAPTNSVGFGFSGPEIFPIDNFVTHLRSADIDGDGLLDLLVVNNARSKINILFNQTGKTNAAPAKTEGRREINQLPPDARFRIDSVASEKRISSLVVADLNGDGRPDLAYFGEPRELVVQYNEGGKGWSAPKRWPLEDGSLDGNALAAGDLNGDGRTDLLLLGEGSLYLLKQDESKSLSEPVKIPYSGSLKSVQIMDIDGDGREDLLLVNWDSTNPIRVRFQNEAGQLGPEIHFTIPPIRSYWADDLDGDKKTDIISIGTKSGRAQVSTFKTRPAEALAGDLAGGQFQVLPLIKTGKPKRGYVWTDLNRDGRMDLLVSDPDGGQLTAYLQTAGGALGPARNLPTLTGVTDIAAGDWNGDGRMDLFLLSSEERQVGVATVDDKGRIPFPTVIPTPGRPLAIALGTPKPGDPASPLSLAIITDNDGKRELRITTAKGEATTRKLAESFKSNPVSMSWLDVNQDGLNDLVVLIPYEKIKFLVQKPDGSFDEQDVAPPGGGSEQPWLSAADVDGDGKPELLLPQKNFIRAVVLQNNPTGGGSDTNSAWSLRVKEQINGSAASSRIVAAGALPRTGSASPWLFLLDAERKALAVCERDSAGVWEIRKSVALPVTEFQSLHAVTLGAGMPNAIAFQGANAVAWMPFQGSVWDLTTLDDYETPIKDGFLNDIITGDLNNDGRRDLIFMETAKNHIDIVTLDAARKLSPAVRWPVFEERTFRNRRAELPEPREAVIGDFTGDKRNDLVILVHDRILLYPQE